MICLNMRLEVKKCIILGNIFYGQCYMQYVKNFQFVTLHLETLRFSDI